MRGGLWLLVTVVVVVVLLMILSLAVALVRVVRVGGHGTRGHDRRVLQGGEGTGRSVFRAPEAAFSPAAESVAVVPPIT